jgi:hypothetical protein
MKSPRLALATFLTLASAAADAADLSQPNVSAPLPDPAILPGSLVPNSAFFLGLSARANWTSLISVTSIVYAIGTSNVFTDGVLSASGSAQGPTNIHVEDRFWRAETQRVSLTINKAF